MRTRFSPSSLKLYQDCSQKYYFAYEDAYVAEHKWEFKRETPALHVGQVIHRCIDRFYRRPLEERDWPALMGILQLGWMTPTGKPWGKARGFESLEQEREYYLQAQAMLRTFFTLQGDVTHIAHIGNQEKFEEMMEADLSPSVQLFGRVDRVDREADGLHIIDYKTGRDADDEFQLMIYTMLVEAEMQERVSRASYFYLKSGETRTFAPDQTLRRETAQRISQTVTGIQQQEFSPRISRRCQWCEYYSLCPAKAQIDVLLEAGQDPQHADFYPLDESLAIPY